jgi:hypothetical protein
MSDQRQKNQLMLAFREEGRSEAPTASSEGTESLAAKRQTESPAIGEPLMEEVCERENCKQALARVKANKGKPGVDGMTVHELHGSGSFWASASQRIENRNGGSRRKRCCRSRSGSEN